MHILGGALKRQKIQTPKGTSTRPTASRMREAVFNLCQFFTEGSCFLDLYAGSGAMGIEAMSRGAKSSLFIENDRHAIRCIRENLNRLKLEKNTHLIPKDVLASLKILSKQKKIFDIIWADPPYQKKINGETLSTLLLKNLDQSCLLAADGLLLIEEAKGALDKIDDGLKNLVLKESRNFGSSALYIFKHVS